MATSTSNAGTRILPFLVHLSSFCWFLCVLLWHWGEDAAKLPESKDFGWFYKYLTFCGFNFQVFTLFVVMCTYIFPLSKTLKQVADDMSCASFQIANSISLLYWGVLVATLKSLEIKTEGGLQISLSHGMNNGAPAFINLSVHLLNSIVVWTDLRIAERSFRTRNAWDHKSRLSRWKEASDLQISHKSGAGLLDIPTLALIRTQGFLIAGAFGVLYMIWSQYATSINKAYPYPFLNEMPQPQGFLIMTVLAFSVLFCFSKLGTKIAGKPGKTKSP